VTTRFILAYLETFILIGISRGVPFFAALCRATEPVSSILFGSAPWSRRNLAQATSPNNDAQPKGVAPAKIT
jgi:hypothetical protein